MIASLANFRMPDSPTYQLLANLPVTIWEIEHFFRVYVASSKHEEGWENSRQLCKPEKYVEGLHNFRELLNFIGYTSSYCQETMILIPLLLPFLSSVCNNVVHKHTTPLWKLKFGFNVTNACAEENYNLIRSSYYEIQWNRHDPNLV